jgi:MtN3 and saliva related transmembrane protein
MDLAVIGYLAGTFTTLSFVPQVVRARRARHTDDLAWGWLIIFEFGLGLWLLYGVVLHNWPMILANSTTMTLCSMLMLMKYRYSKPAARAAGAGVGP